MINLVREYIKKENLISDNEAVVVAVSCGADSMALLDIMRRLNYRVIIAHVNHQKREQSKIEEEYIIDYANKNNLPIEVLHLEYNHNNNFHDEAHHKRYHFFEEVLKKYNAKFLATAHHADDNAETIILNTMRGSNLFGYGGISAKIDYKNYSIIRPLLFLSKADLEKYDEVNNVKFFLDESNLENDYKRNRIRHFIIPLLKDECPDYLNKIIAYSKQVKEAFSFIRNQSIKYLEKTKNNIELPSFNDFDIALKKDIICLLLERYEMDKNQRIIESILEILSSEKTTNSLTLAGNKEFVKRYNLAYIIEKNVYTNDSVEINLNQEVIYKQKYRFYFTKNIGNTNAKYIKLCYNRLAFPFMIRSYKENDEILMPYGHKKINRLFIDNKIPKEERLDIPVIEMNKEVIWVYNLAKSKMVLDMKDCYDIYFVCEVLDIEK